MYKKLILTEIITALTIYSATFVPSLRGDCLGLILR